MVPADGYAWWYVDALSDCGRYGLVVIGFIGSVFSPYYALSRRRGPADPFAHCAVNVALYGPGRRWAMTERGRGDVAVTPDRLMIGPSALSWDGTCLTISIDERDMPSGRRIRGVVRVHPAALIDHEVALDREGRHRWRPIAPRARVEVAMEQPDTVWSGNGYFDSNHGDAPLAAGFSTWTWSRASLGDDTLVLYDGVGRNGQAFHLARLFTADGGMSDVMAPPEARLKTGVWGVKRTTRADAGTVPRLLRRLEDSPFYTRSEIVAQVLGRQAHGVHESLDLDRVEQRWVQLMLPFRMPRIARR